MPAASLTFPDPSALETTSLSENKEESSAFVEVKDSTSPFPTDAGASSTIAKAAQKAQKLKEFRVKMGATCLKYVTVIVANLLSGEKRAHYTLFVRTLVLL
jgi:hypothetical protein